MTTTTDITPEQRLTLVKHLANGRDLDQVATIMHLDRSTVLDIASHHGYPSTELLTRAVGLLEQKRDRDAPPTEHPQAAQIVRQEASRSAAPPSPTASRFGRLLTTGAPEQVVTKPDEIRVLINTSKDHPSKRIQAAGEKVLDAVARLRDLVREDQEKNAAKRQAEKERADAKAEVERLERQLREARDKLRSATASKGSREVSKPTGDAAKIRAWAAETGVECPTRGQIPARVRTVYDEAHQEPA